MFWALCAIVGGVVGNGKGMGGSGFVWGLLLGPIGVLVVLVSDGNRVACPFCREMIHREAKVCPRCQRELATPDAAAIARTRVQTPPPPATRGERIFYRVFAAVVVLSIVAAVAADLAQRAKVKRGLAAIDSLQSPTGVAAGEIPIPGFPTGTIRRDSVRRINDTTFSVLWSEAITGSKVSLVYCGRIHAEKWVRENSLATKGLWRKIEAPVIDRADGTSPRFDERLERTCEIAREIAGR